MSSAQAKELLKKIEPLLPEVSAAHRRSAAGEIARIKRSITGRVSDKKTVSRLTNLEHRLRTSADRRTWRKQHRPQPTYDTHLPILAKKDEIIEAIRSHPVIIISGETGSGKTTQIPKFCLEAGRGLDGMIGCTQPRRIAATTVARRIAEELAEDVGRSVGYKIRFTDRTGKDAFIKIMTDGVLLAETQSDPNLNAYDTLIVDEAHERSLNIDFILGILKTLLKKRNDLKLIITSATIDTEKFSEAFAHAPIIEVSGRMFPVEVRYLSPAQDADDEELTYVDLALSAVENLETGSHWGDVLVFMPTEQDIRETCELIEARKFKATKVYPLFARLSAAEQSKVFLPAAGRKIIVATNVAETSITIPGIKYVIDTGLARISQYLPRSRTTALPVVPISRSSADQRKGRCGRVADGVCIRLYSEEDYAGRPLFTPPEILRANLAEVILRMIALNLGDVTRFPFIDPPVRTSIKDGSDLLLEMGAIRSESPRKRSRRQTGFALTERGRLMAKIPADPRISRMLIEAQEEGCLKEIAVIAAALSIQDPRERPAEKTAEADQMHARFKDPASDFVTLLNIWKRYNETLEQEKSTGSLKKFCKTHYLSFRRMREWRDIHSQIKTILRESGFKRSQQPLTEPVSLTSGDKAQTDAFSSGYTALHKSILSGFLSNIAVKKEKFFYRAAKNKEVMIFPGSGIFNSAGTWIVAAEMVETSRLFARTAANIDPRWLEELGRTQCRYTYLQPHWERNRGEVVASEQVSLYGLIIVPARSVSYGPINPQEASDIFIQQALVAEDVKFLLPFMQHNRRIINEVKEMEDKTRRRDLLVSEQDIFQFYKERLPGIYDMRTLQHNLKQLGSDQSLRMTKENLLRTTPDNHELALFPDRIALGNSEYPCVYRFEPGRTDDGVTVKIPVRLAPAVEQQALDWLVPGLLAEKISALIKGLPKTYRRRLVPVTATVDTIVREMPKVKGSLISALGTFIFERFGLDIPATAWPEDDLPAHLKMRIAILGPEGQELRSGRDRSILHQDISPAADPDLFRAAAAKFEKTGLTCWDFGDLPETQTIAGQDGTKWIAYPGLQESENGVNLRFFEERQQALACHKEGVAALYSILFSRDLKFLKKILGLPPSLARQADYFGGAGRFENRLISSVVKELFYRDIRTRKAFNAHADVVRPLILKTGQAKLAVSLDVLKAYHDVRRALADLETAEKGNLALKSFLDTLRLEMAKLVPDHFMELYDTARLEDFPRYLKAIGIRMQRGRENLDKERGKAAVLEVYTAHLDRLLETLAPAASDAKRQMIEEFFWLIEEFKVSLFAQELKTPVPVSAKRLDKKLKEIDRMV